MCVSTNVTILAPRGRDSGNLKKRIRSREARTARFVVYSLLSSSSMRSHRERAVTVHSERQEEFRKKRSGAKNEDQLEARLLRQYEFVRALPRATNKRRREMNSRGCRGKRIPRESNRNGASCKLGADDSGEKDDLEFVQL